MRICPDILRLTTRLTACFSVVILAVLCGNAWAATENVWQGASQGDWDVAANWSLGHAPTAGECAVLPDTGSSYAIAVNGEFLIGALQLAPRAGDGVTAVTLTGIGFLTNDVKVADHVVGANRRLVLDGASICFQYESETAETNGQIAVDGEVAVVDDASRLSAYALNLVGDGAKLSLTAGTVQLIHTTYSGANAIQIDGGTYSSYRIGPPAVEGGGNPSAADCRITYLQNGGQSSHRINVFSTNSVLTVSDGEYIFRGEAEFAADCTLAISGGTARFNAVPAIDPTASLSLTGGTVYVTDLPNGTTAYDRLFAEASGTVVRFALQVSDARTIMCDGPLVLDTIQNMTAEARPVLKVSTLVFSQAYPFLIYGSVPNRYFCIEGPTTIRPTADMDDMGGREVYPFASGDITVDTRDWNDSSVTRTVKLSLGVKGAASLTVMGGGTMELKPTRGANSYSWDGARAFSCVTVSNNATLTIPSVATSGNYIPLVAERLVLGAGATLNMSAGEGNGVYAASWSIDPSARINVTVLDSFTTGATPILVNTGSDAIDDYTDRITLSGATSGAVLKREGGNIVLVKKTVTGPDGAYRYEWIGHSPTSPYWSTAANWSCGVEPPTSKTRYPMAFGAVDDVVDTVYDVGGNPSAVSQIVFRATAVSSFRVSDGLGQPISYLNVNGGYSGTPNATLYSTSAVSQRVDCDARIAGNGNNRFTLYAAAAGPLVFGGGVTAAGSKQAPIMHVCGDIRTTGYVTYPRLSFTKRPAKPDMSRLFVEAGRVTITNQTGAFDVKNAGFRVASGAMLTFRGPNSSDGTFYQWTAEPQKIVVDGTMRIESRLRGGACQQYGGAGTLFITRTMYPATAASALEFADTLSVNLPDVWRTVSTSFSPAGANTPLTLVARSGRPVLCVPDGWTYGPAANITTTTTPADRAAYVHAGATLAIDATGGTATFEDPVAGPGTLEVVGGALAAPGGISPETTLKVGAQGAFEWRSALTLARLETENGAELRFTDTAEILTVSGEVSLAGVTLRAPESAFDSLSRQTRVLVADSISGLPVFICGNRRGQATVKTRADGKMELWLLPRCPLLIRFVRCMMSNRTGSKT